MSRGSILAGASATAALFGLSASRSRAAEIDFPPISGITGLGPVPIRLPNAIRIDKSLASAAFTKVKLPDNCLVCFDWSVTDVNWHIDEFEFGQGVLIDLTGQWDGLPNRWPVRNDTFDPATDRRPVSCMNPGPPMAFGPCPVPAGKEHFWYPDRPANEMIWGVNGNIYSSPGPAIGGYRMWGIGSQALGRYSTTDSDPHVWKGVDGANGPYQAATGKNGVNGGDGSNGIRGRNGINFTLSVDTFTSRSTGSIFIVTDGSDGLAGGNGGHAEMGGGATCGQGFEGPQGAGNGGNGGNGGRGGDGGDTSRVTLAFNNALKADCSVLGSPFPPTGFPSNDGRIYIAGSPGRPGAGGRGGSSGGSPGGINGCGILRLQSEPGGTGGSPGKNGSSGSVGRCIT